jgi:hypothetical protein
MADHLDTLPVISTKYLVIAKMSDSFTHVDTYPTLAVSVNEPTDHFQLDTNTTTPSEYNSSDPSPIESRSHASQWNTDLFPNEFLDGSWSNPLDQQQQSPLPQSSAQQFWSASQNSTALAYQSQGGGVGGGSSLDYSRAIAAVSAAAGVTRELCRDMKLKHQLMNRVQSTLDCPWIARSQSRLWLR